MDRWGAFEKMVVIEFPHQFEEADTEQIGGPGL